MLRQRTIQLSRHEMLHASVATAASAKLAFDYASADLQSEFAAILKDYVGRESPLYHADRLSEHYKK